MTGQISGINRLAQGCVAQLKKCQHVLVLKKKSLGMLKEENLRSVTFNMFSFGTHLFDTLNILLIASRRYFGPRTVLY